VGQPDPRPGGSDPVLCLRSCKSQGHASKESLPSFRLSPRVDAVSSGLLFYAAARRTRSDAHMLAATMLFLAVLLGVSLCCLFSVPSGVKLVGSRCVCMVGGLFVKSGLVMLGRFPMVPGGVRGMF
jgi:hypothetical protein